MSVLLTAYFRSDARRLQHPAAAQRLLAEGAEVEDVVDPLVEEGAVFVALDVGAVDRVLPLEEELARLRRGLFGRGRLHHFGLDALLRRLRRRRRRLGRRLLRRGPLGRRGKAGRARRYGPGGPQP